MNILNVKWKWTIPNILSLVRMALLPAFVLLYINSVERPVLMWWAIGVLVFSGLTDLFDGWIARHFNQISDVGKLLDPLADKLTQLVVVVCLATRYREVMALTIVCFCKEIVQVIGGLLLLRHGDEVRGSRWFGKVSTFVFYSSMAAIVSFPNMPGPVRVALVVLVSVMMLGTFFGYLKTYLSARRALLSQVDATETE